MSVVEAVLTHHILYVGELPYSCAALPTGRKAGWRAYDHRRVATIRGLREVYVLALAEEHLLFLREIGFVDFEFALKEILILPTADVVVPPSWADVVEKVDLRFSKAYGMCYLCWVVRSHVLQVFLQAVTLGRSLAHLIADVEHAQNAAGIEPLEDGHIESYPGGLVNRCRGVFA